jgi:hypothetical protein
LAFSVFLLVFNASRGTWFQLSPSAYREWWELSNYASAAAQFFVSLEAYWLLACQVPNFAWRWRVLAVLCLPCVAMAGILAIDSAHWYHNAFYFNQALGYGLAFVVFLVAGLGAVLPLRLSRNALIHSSVVSWMWFASATGYHFYHAEWWGWWLAACGPAAGALAWLVLMRESGEAQPPQDSPALKAAALRKLEEEARRFEGR